MKKYFIASIAIAAVIFTACTNNSDSQKVKDSTGTTSAAGANESMSSTQQNNSPVKDIVAGYLQIKNGLVNDNGNDAASGGKTLVAAIGNINVSSFTADQKKIYSDMQDDLKENAEHISENADKIEHQREHFEMLSQDMYDLVKSFTGGPIMYKDFCPMANDNKGAYWLSETKEIQNPYFGKKMPVCGEVKEEIK